MPLANKYPAPDEPPAIEPRYPLRLYVCGGCFLVQLDPAVDPGIIFEQYTYFSSYSDTLVAAGRSFAQAVTERLGLVRGELVVEVASNDGYLLRHFADRGHAVLGIEPACNVAAVALARGIPTVTRFLGARAADEIAGAHGRARLVIANNVLAHVPDLHDFIEGVRRLLAPGGTVTAEFHHLLNLIERCQFDTIYHEHCQYLSLDAVVMACRAHELSVVDVEPIPFQGGSLRVYIRHRQDAGKPAPAVWDLLRREREAGLRTLDRYARFASEIRGVQTGLVAFLEQSRRRGQSVVGYGAAAKATTLLNSSGVGEDLIEYVVDRSPHKQGRRLPGTCIPICHPDRVIETKPAYLLAIAWNLIDEIAAQMSYIRSWGARFVLPVPRLTLLP